MTGWGPTASGGYSSRNTNARLTKNSSRIQAGIQITFKNSRRIIIRILIIKHLLVMSQLKFRRLGHLFKGILLLQCHFLLLILPITTCRNTTEQSISHTGTSRRTSRSSCIHAKRLSHHCSKASRNHIKAVLN